MSSAMDCRNRLAGVLFGVLSLLVAVPASAAEAISAEKMFDGQWHFSVTPYLWLPTIYVNGTFAGPLGIAQGVTTGMHSAPSSYLHNLSFAAMVTGEARKNDWSLFADYIYLKFRNQDTAVRSIAGPGGAVSGTVDTGSSQSLTGNVLTVAGAYTVWRERGSHLDILAGTRYLNMDASLDWNVAGTGGVLPGLQGDTSMRLGKWDGIIGFKGQLPLGDGGRWFMPYYVDAGWGSANTTWQALIAMGYRFDWGNLVLALRSLSYNFNGHNSDGVDARFTGLALGATFPF